MAASNDLLPEALIALSQAFAAPGETGLAVRGQVTRDDVRHFLEVQITRLLDRNPGLLMHILYRVDVAEEQVKAAFRQASPEALPGRLAELLIERQLQKLHLRRRYRQQGP